MDSTGRLWKSHALKGKLAAGFTVSTLPSGDKQSTLTSMFVFAMQHGMLWVGNAILPEQHSGVPYDEAANRLGSWSGLMAQGGHTAPTANSFPRGGPQDRTAVRRQRREDTRKNFLPTQRRGVEMIPTRFEAVLFGFVLSGLMSFIVGGVSSVVSSGAFSNGIFQLWLKSWLTGWLPFPIVLLVGPMARRMVQAILARD